MPNIPFRLLRAAYHHLGRSKCRPSVMSMHRTDPDIAEFMHHNWKACLAHALAEAWPQRTAEDERRDVLAHLRIVTGNYLRIYEDHAERGNAKASERCEAKADCLELCHIDIRNGAHEGASTR